MKVFGENEARRQRAGGLKLLLANGMLLPYVNPLVRTAAKALPPSIGQRLPLRVPVVEFRPATAAPVRLLDSHRDLFARDVWWGGGRPTSPADARILRCVEQLCSQGGTFADIGAYAGVFAMLAARAHPDVKAFAYEIVPENYLLMVRNVIENDLISRVECKLLGLAAGEGVIRIPSALNLSSNESSVSIGSVFDGGVEIPLSTLDAEAAGWVGPVVMKIDVEGFELDVFRGGVKTLKKHRPDIVCEILPDASATAYSEIEALLLPLGYRLFQSRDEGLIQSDRIVPTAAGKDWLFTCRPDFAAVLSAVG